MNYEFVHPWLLALVALPLLLRWVLPPWHTSSTAIRAPFFDRLALLLDARPERGATVHGTSWIRWIAQALLWSLLVVALARPQQIEAPIHKVIPSRDLLLLVDLSGSMETRDFTNAAGERIDRLTAVKEVLDDFLTRREGDRVGLVVFGNAAFVQVPFTEDLEVCRLLLDETGVRMAGPRTAFGDAIGLGITLFEESEVEERVMIALTDGNDTGSRIPPADAARIAADRDITIHVVGIGDPTSVGEALLDEEALQDVARSTGGRYFFALDRDELAGIYGELDRIGSRDIETESYRPRTDLFHWPLAAFLLLGLIEHGALLLGRREGAHA